MAIDAVQGTYFFNSCHWNCHAGFGAFAIPISPRLAAGAGRSAPLAAGVDGLDGVGGLEGRQSLSCGGCCRWKEKLAFANEIPFNGNEFGI